MSAANPAADPSIEDKLRSNGWMSENQVKAFARNATRMQQRAAERRKRLKSKSTKEVR